MNASDVLISPNGLAALGRIDRRTVDRRLAGISPAKQQGKTRLFRLADALPALLMQSQNAELEKQIVEDRAREQRGRARLIEMEIGEREQNLIPADWWARALEEFGLELKAEVLAADVPMKTKEALCGKLARLKPSRIFSAHKGERTPRKETAQ